MHCTASAATHKQTEFIMHFLARSVDNNFHSFLYDSAETIINGLNLTQQTAVTEWWFISVFSDSGCTLGELEMQFDLPCKVSFFIKVSNTERDAFSKIAGALDMRYSDPR